MQACGILFVAIMKKDIMTHWQLSDFVPARSSILCIRFGEKLRVGFRCYCSRIEKVHRDGDDCCWGERTIRANHHKTGKIFPILITHPRLRVFS